MLDDSFYGKWKKVTVASSNCHNWDQCNQLQGAKAHTFCMAGLQYSNINFCLISYSPWCFKSIFNLTNTLPCFHFSRDSVASGSSAPRQAPTSQRNRKRRLRVDVDGVWRQKAAGGRVHDDDDDQIGKLEFFSPLFCFFANLFFKPMLCNI